MKLIDVERIVRAGAGSLGESLHFYWPSTGNNEVPESNIALHLGRAFLDEGFFTYADAHTKDAVKVHLDLMAIHPRAQILVAGEFKRLYSTQQVAGLASDLDRITKFKPQDDPTLRHEGLAVADRFGLLAGTTHREDYARWFTTNETDIKDPTNGVLDGLWRQLPEKTIWSGRVLSDYWASGEHHTHWFIYALFPLY